jgi:hypothetical protein
MKKLSIAIALLTLALLPMACQKEKTGNDEFRFTATTERLQNDDAKVQLVEERYIIWEYDDEISIGSNTSGDTKNKAWLYYSDPNSTDWGAYNGVFLTTLPSNSEYFLGLHPCSDNNVISSLGGTSFSATIDIPAAQTYRNDNTFDKQVFPMVAWYGGTWTSDPYTPFNLDFHSLAAIVRLQFLNTTGAASAIRSITVTSPTSSSAASSPSTTTTPTTPTSRASSPPRRPSPSTVASPAWPSTTTSCSPSTSCSQPILAATTPHATATSPSR